MDLYDELFIRSLDDRSKTLIEIYICKDVCKNTITFRDYSQHLVPQSF